MLAAMGFFLVALVALRAFNSGGVAKILGALNFFRVVFGAPIWTGGFFGMGISEGCKEGKVKKLGIGLGASERECEAGSSM